LPMTDEDGQPLPAESLVPEDIPNHAPTTLPEGKATTGLQLETAKALLERMVREGQRVRLFDLEGKLVADSRDLVVKRREVEVDTLLPSEGLNGFLSELFEDYQIFVDRIQLDKRIMPYREWRTQTAFHYHEAKAALAGEFRTGLRGNRDTGGLVLLAGAPIQHYKKVYAGLLLTSDDSAIEDSIQDARIEVLKLFSVALFIALLLSSYLAGTIVRPILKLASAADQLRSGQGKPLPGRHVMRHGQKRHKKRFRFWRGDPGTLNLRDGKDRVESEIIALIPNFSDRGDEIGDLSVAMREMTRALWARMDAIERFAADVSHELKNPITSLQSAIETLERLQEKEAAETGVALAPMAQGNESETFKKAEKRRESRAKLMEILRNDIQRLDRLITDIAAYSRLEGQISRQDMEPLDLAALLMAITRSFQTQLAMTDGKPHIVYAGPPLKETIIAGVPDHLARLIQNLVENAISFSPPGGLLRLVLTRQLDVAKVMIEDDGPGIPENKRRAVFDRFHSSRPPGEKFGLHSGLGLSISKEIAEAHGGSIHAENRLQSDGRVCGARFTVLLPLWDEEEE